MLSGGQEANWINLRTEEAESVGHHICKVVVHCSKFDIDAAPPGGEGGGGGGSANVLEWMGCATVT